MKAAIAALVLAGAATTIALWLAPVAPAANEPTLRVQIPNSTANISAKPDIHVYLHNGSSVPLYITTNLDPFVGGAGMFRNYYVLVSGVDGATQSTRLFLGALPLPMDEGQLVQSGVLALLRPGQTYAGRLPIDAWSELVSQPGTYHITAGYRGTGVGAPLNYPLLDKHLESNEAAVVVLP